MFVVTLSKTSLKKLGAGAACCALVVFSAMLGRFISTRTVAVAAPVNRIESAQDIQTWFTGYGLEVDGASITADKVKIPRKWDDSFSAFNGVVQQSGMDLARYKGKTVEKWSALLPAASNGETSRYGVLLVYKKKAVGAYLLEKPSGTVLGLQDAQNELAKQTSGEDYSGDWGERHDEQLTDSTAQQTSGEPETEPEAAPQAAPYTELPLDAVADNAVCALNAVITSQADALGYTVADSYTAFENSGADLVNAGANFSVDPHPNRAGHELLAETHAKKIRM